MKSEEEGPSGCVGDGSARVLPGSESSAGPVRRVRPDQQVQESGSGQASPSPCCPVGPAPTPCSDSGSSHQAARDAFSRVVSPALGWGNLLALVSGAEGGFGVLRTSRFMAPREAEKSAARDAR